MRVPNKIHCYLENPAFAWFQREAKATGPHGVSPGWPTWLEMAVTGTSQARGVGLLPDVSPRQARELQRIVLEICCFWQWKGREGGPGLQKKVGAKGALEQWDTLSLTICKRGSFVEIGGFAP